MLLENFIDITYVHTNCWIDARISLKKHYSVCNSLIKINTTTSIDSSSCAWIHCNLVENALISKILCLSIIIYTISAFWFNNSYLLILHVFYVDLLLWRESVVNSDFSGFFTDFAEMQQLDNKIHFNQTDCRCV